MTQKYLKEYFDYHESGNFILKKKRANRDAKKVGKILDLSIHHTGYKRIEFRGRKSISLHAAIYLWHHGYLPEIVDHINRNKTDNRIENLRAATRKENSRNSKNRDINTSGYRGVTIYKTSSGENRYRVNFRINGKQKHIGVYTDIIFAARVYDDLAKKYHGEFACLNF